MTTAFLLRLNRPAVFIGLCVNLPWIIVPWYTLTTIAGGLMLNRPIAADFGRRFDALMELSFYSSGVPIAGASTWSRRSSGVFSSGSTAGAIVLGIAAYFVTVPLLTRWRAARDAQEGAADRHVDAP